MALLARWFMPKYGDETEYVLTLSQLIYGRSRRLRALRAATHNFSCLHGEGWATRPSRNKLISKLPIQKTIQFQRENRWQNGPDSAWKRRRRRGGPSPSKVFSVHLGWGSASLSSRNWMGWIPSLLQYDEVVRQMRLAGIIFINPQGTRVTLCSVCKTRSKGAGR